MKRKKIYVCAPFSGTPEQMKQNTIKTCSICRNLYEQGVEPVAPQLYYPRFLREEDQKERRDGLDAGLEWLEQCDEIWVFGDRVTEGMRAEVRFAEAHNIPIQFVKEGPYD